MRKLSKARIILVTVFLSGILLGSIVYAAYQHFQPIRNVGTVRVIGVDVFADAELTSRLTEIPWGVMSPDESRNVTVWIQNTGNYAQKLVMWTESWNPTSAFDFISLTWDYDDSWIPVNDAILVVFTLSLDADITGVTNFSFELWVKGVH